MSTPPDLLHRFVNKLELRTALSCLDGALSRWQVSLLDRGSLAAVPHSRKQWFALTTIQQKRPQNRLHFTNVTMPLRPDKTSHRSGDGFAVLAH
jgi:hypothetical protein